MSKKRKDGKIHVTTVGTLNTQRFAECFIKAVRRMEQENETDSSKSNKTQKIKFPSC